MSELFIGQHTPFDVTVTFHEPSPPLTANQRMHWARKAKLTARVRKETATIAHQLRIPELGRCEVTLTWVVRTKHRRDADNIVPTLKAMCDGLVDAGIVTDDTPDLMVKHMPRIEYTPGATPHLRLRILQLPAG